MDLSPNRSRRVVEYTSKKQAVNPTIIPDQHADNRQLQEHQPRLWPIHNSRFLYQDSFPLILPWTIHVRVEINLMHYQSSDIRRGLNFKNIKMRLMHWPLENAWLMIFYRNSLRALPKKQPLLMSPRVLGILGVPVDQTWWSMQKAIEYLRYSIPCCWLFAPYLAFPLVRLRVFTFRSKWKASPASPGPGILFLDFINTIQITICCDKGARNQFGFLLLLTKRVGVGESSSESPQIEASSFCWVV